MKETERDHELLKYILESISRIEQYTRGGRETFLREDIVQDAVLRRLETLADAASHLSPIIKTQHPSIPWRDIYAFRNVAAHGYLSLNLERVWTTVADHLPALKSVVEQELGRTRGESGS